MDDWWCGRRPCGAVLAQSRSGGCLLLQAGVGETVGVGAGLDDVAAEGEPADDRGAKRRVGEGRCYSGGGGGVRGGSRSCAAEVQASEGVGSLAVVAAGEAPEPLTHSRRRSMT